jgi:hypothetical protein
MEQTDLRTRRTPARLAFADHVHGLVAGDGAPSSPKRSEMLTRVDPSLDRAVVLFQDVIEVRYWPVPTVFVQSAFSFEPHDRRRVRAVTVGVDDMRHGMVLPPQSFGQEALCCSRVLLRREEKVQGRAKRIHRTIHVAPVREPRTTYPSGSQGNGRCDLNPAEAGASGC